MIHDLLLTDKEKRVLEDALEFYIRLGLGQLSDVATRLEMLTHKRNVDVTEIKGQLAQAEEKLLKVPWKLEDSGTSAHTVAAFGMQCRLLGIVDGADWAARRLRELEDEKI